MEFNILLNKVLPLEIMDNILIVKISFHTKQNIKNKSASIGILEKSYFVLNRFIKI